MLSLARRSRVVCRISRRLGRVSRCQSSARGALRTNHIARSRGTAWPVQNFTFDGSSPSVSLNDSGARGRCDGVTLLDPQFLRQRRPGIRGHRVFWDDRISERLRDRAFQRRRDALPTRVRRIREQRADALDFLRHTFDEHDGNVSRLFVLPKCARDLAAVRGEDVKDR